MSNDGSESEVIFFSRMLRTVHSDNRPSFEVESDPRHADIIVSELGLTSEKIKTVDTPENREGMESCAGKRLLVSPLLFGEDTKECRSVKNLARRMQHERI